MPLDTGVHLGRYEILCPLGSGGMGEVYRARDPQLGRDVALKVLPTAVASDPDRLRRFEREARAAGALNHPNILAIHDFGTDSGVAYAVTELLDGTTLRALLEDGAVPSRKALHYAREIARGLADAHDHGIVHRDLKPENIFITGDGRVKILDFGLARIDESEGPGPDSQLATMTRGTTPGMILGTLGYMAPEQVRGHAADSRSDIFALGAVLFEMVTGRRAFEGETAADTLTAILRETPPEPSQVNPRVPREVDRIVVRCLEKRPGERFRSAHDLAFALDAQLEGSWSSGPFAARRWPGRARSLGRAALVLALVAAGAAAGYFVARSRPGAPPPQFLHLTFRRGYIHSARVSADGHTIVYGAEFDGQPLGLFSTTTDGVESRSLGIGADVVGISRSGEMALLLGRHHLGSFVTAGTLARAALSGGSPRALLDDVNDADIAPDGSNFAVVRQAGSVQRLEYPIGTTLYESPGWISHPRISPDGRRVAFLEHPIYGDDDGFVTMAEAGGTARRVAGPLSSVQGLAWSRQGGGLWYSALVGTSGRIAVIEPDRAPREVVSAPGALRIQDILPDGTLLALADDDAALIAGRFAGHDIRPMTWWGDDDLGGIADDGSVFAGCESTTLFDGDYGSYIQRAGEPQPVRLGPGVATGMTSDGSHVAALTRDGALIVYPTGPGATRRFALDPVQIESAAGRMLTFSRDGSRIAFLGFEPEHGTRAYIFDLAGGRPRAVTPPGVDRPLITPDGGVVAALDGHGHINLYPVDGGAPRLVPGTLPGDKPVRWDREGRALFVWDGSFPASVFRIDLAAGTRQLALQFAPPGQPGARYGRMVMTPDAASYLYRVRVTQSYLDLVTMPRRP